MPKCVFVSDLHGSTQRYEKLFQLIENNRPDAVFIGGDLLPHAMHRMPGANGKDFDFVNDFLIAAFTRLKGRMAGAYPKVFVIFGNDDPRSEEKTIEEAARTGIWEYIHERESRLDGYQVYGYAYVNPTPFQLKDWDRYDVSRFVDPGCIAPEEGRRTVPVEVREIRHSSIKKDLAVWEDGRSFEKAVFLFHAPPYKTSLDRAALDDKSVDHAPLDVHVGSIAIRQFIERAQPLITLHGHIHEAARITGQWQDRIGATYAFTAAHDGPELAVVAFDPQDPAGAKRELL